MTRGRRGTDGAQDGGSWRPDEYGEDDGGDRPGRGSHRRSSDLSGPPWETGSWEADPTWEPPGRAEPDWQGHPSGPLPAAQRPELPGPHWQGGPAGPVHIDPHPSGPLPPLPEPGRGWPEGAGSGWLPEHGDDGYLPGGHGAGPRGDDGYPGDGYPGGGYAADGYPADEYASGDYQTGGYQAGDYQTGGFQTGGFQTGGFEAGGYPGTDGYPAGDYATGGYPAVGHAGSGYGEPVQQRDYGDTDYQPDQDGYDGPGARRRDDRRGSGYSGGDSGNDAGYPDRGGWYSDVDEQQVWAGDDEADSGFLPGLADESGRDDGRRRGSARSDGRSGRRGSGRGAPRRRGGMRRIMPRVFLTVLVLAVLGGAGYGYHLYRTYIAPPDYSGPGSGSVVVHILPGSTATAIGDLLAQKGVVASGRAFANAAKASPQGNALEPGYYRLHLHMKASLAFALLLKPSARVTFKVVIPEGWRLSRIIATLGQATGNPAGYQAAIGKTAALGLPSYAKGNAEGFLFPATYTIQPGTSPSQVLRGMVQRFDQEAASVNLPSVASHDQLSEHDVIVVASLIQAEGGRLQDFPKIARVIYNRLNQGMQLELDSTVMYALHQYGIMASTQQLNVNSPYNTYRHFGLPPTPIDSPGDAAIQAALHPAAGPWLYFVTVDPKTGVTEFTSDPNVFAQLRNDLQQNIANGK